MFFWFFFVPSSSSSFLLDVDVAFWCNSSYFAWFSAHHFNYYSSICIDLDAISLVGHLQNVFIDDKELIIEDVDFSNSHLVLIVREGRKFRLCSVSFPLPSGQV